VLFVGHGVAEGLPFGGVGLGDGQRPFGHPRETHAVGEPRRAEPLLDVLEAVAFLAQQVFFGDANAVELDFGVALRVTLAAHMRDVPNDVHAVGVGRDDEH